MRVKRPGVYALICKKHMGAIYQKPHEIGEKTCQVGYLLSFHLKYTLKIYSEVPSSIQ